MPNVSGFHFTDTGEPLADRGHYIWIVLVSFSVELACYEWPPYDDGSPQHEWPPYDDRSPQQVGFKIYLLNDDEASTGGEKLWPTPIYIIIILLNEVISNKQSLLNLAGTPCGHGVFLSGWSLVLFSSRLLLRSGWRGKGILAQEPELHQSCTWLEMAVGKMVLNYTDS